MSIRSIPVHRKPLDATVEAPPSKSVTHRALISAALAEGPSLVRNPLDADDTRVTRQGLAALGVAIEDAEQGWRVAGSPPTWEGGATLELLESGTSMRFLTAVASLGRRPSRLDGAPRLRERPMATLAEALEGLGATVRLDPTGGGLPLEAGGSPLRGGEVRVAADQSSQFASALMLIAPRTEGGIRLSLTPPAVSLPYVSLTARVMERFGATVERTGELRWALAGQPARGQDYRVEGDHSSASYFLAAAAVLGGRVTMQGLDPNSAQADARFVDILEQLGCEVHRGDDAVEIRGSGQFPAFDLTMDDAPDVVPTLAVLGLFADGPCTVRGVSHLRLKESDRLEVLAHNLRALGREARAEDDRLEIGPPGDAPRGACVATASDHRMAMAFAVAGLRVEGVSVDDDRCVAKSNPRFWEQLAALTA